MAVKSLCKTLSDIAFFSPQLKCTYYNLSNASKLYSNHTPSAVAQWVSAFDPQAEGWVFESHLGQPSVIKTGSDSSTAKRSAISVRVTHGSWKTAFYSKINVGMILLVM